MLIPHRFAIGCIDSGWILRNEIIWAKRNGMPESVTDRFSKKHEYFFLMVKQQKYYFDLDGVRTPYDKKLDRWGGNMVRGDYKTKTDQFAVTERAGRNMRPDESGKNPGDVSDFWDIPTQPSSAKHYATFNTDLIDKPIVAGCPEFVCKKCGKPREKIIENGRGFTGGICNGCGASKAKHHQGERSALRKHKETFSGGSTTMDDDGYVPCSAPKEIGLTDCGCNAGFEGGVILDPFCGTGTTLIRGLQLNRQVIGIDGSKEYCDIAEKRIKQELAQLKLAI